MISFEVIDKRKVGRISLEQRAMKRKREHEEKPTRRVKGGRSAEGLYVITVSRDPRNYQHLLGSPERKK